MSQALTKFGQYCKCIPGRWLLSRGTDWSSHPYCNLSLLRLPRRISSKELSHFHLITDIRPSKFRSPTKSGAYNIPRRRGHYARTRARCSSEARARRESGDRVLGWIKATNVVQRSTRAAEPMEKREMLYAEGHRSSLRSTVRESGWAVRHTSNVSGSPFESMSEWIED